MCPAMRTRTLKTLIDAGHGDRICPSHDCICVTVHSELPDGTIPEKHEMQRGNPDQYLYMHRHVIPEQVSLGATEAQVRTLLVDNPRCFLAGA